MPLTDIPGRFALLFIAALATYLSLPNLSCPWLKTGFNAKVSLMFKP